MKKRIFALTLALTLAAGAFTAAAAEEDDIITKLTEEKTTQYFTEDAVPEEDVKTILAAGINAESGMNSQNWHFSALGQTSVLDEITAEMSANMPEGAKAMTKAQMGDSPLAIVVSCGEGGEFDAGLATQNMGAAAQALGYGIKIVSSPTMVLNGDNAAHYKEQLGIPDTMSAVAVLLIGLPADTSEMDPDTVTGASVRNDFDEMATLVLE